MSSVLRTRAIVLRRTNYGEADRILQLLTPEGKKSVMARGVRKEKSRLAGGIELLAVSDIVINSGRGELGILTSARLVKFYLHILEDYDRMQFAYEVMKQISRASEMVDIAEWYDVMSDILMALDAKSVSFVLTQTWFYVRYAELMGYELSLFNDINGQPLGSDSWYVYDDTEKGLRMHERGDIGADHIKLLRLMQKKSLSILSQIGGIDEIVQDCLVLARRHAALQDK